MRDQLDPDHWCNGGEYGSSHPDAIAMEAEILREMERLKETQRWIPVDEQLPDEDVPVLCIDIRGVQRVGWNGWGEWCGPEIQSKITHWMSLPEPPTEKQS